MEGSLHVCELSHLLERFGGSVRGQKTGDDDSREVSEALAREVDLLDRFLAPQLLDLERMAIESAHSHTVHKQRVRGS